MEGVFNLRLFVATIVLSLAIAAVGYSVQYLIFPDYFAVLGNGPGLSFRLLRMLLGYVAVAIVFLKLTGQPLSNLGLRYEGLSNFIVATLLGISIYLVPSFIFVKYRIFTAQWFYRSWATSLFYLLLIGLMACITDLWTRGYILLQIDRIYGKLPAIAVQNFLWFVIHIYEIVMLIPYIGLFPSIALTLFLGIAGDLVAIHYKNIVGLMLGHVILNLFVILAGKQVIMI